MNLGYIHPLYGTYFQKIAEKDKDDDKLLILSLYKELMFGNESELSFLLFFSLKC